MYLQQQQQNRKGHYDHKILCGNNSYPGDRFYVFLGTYSSSSFMYSPFTAFTSVSLSASNISKCPRLQLNTLCPLLRGTNNKMKLLLNIQIAPFGVVHFIQVGRRWNQRIRVQVSGSQKNGRTDGIGHPCYVDVTPDRKVASRRAS